jgi:predicted O-methyltransferase YrrM
MNVLEIPVLKEMVESGMVRDARGDMYPAGPSGIDIGYAQALHDLVLREHPAVAVEVGMAHGISTLAMLSALEQTGGRLISIDIAQSTWWHSVGTANVERAGYANRHELIEAPDYTALPEVLRRNNDVGFGYIDGTHTFDNVLLDFFYVDKMIKPGGVIGFNDCIMPAIHRCLNFLRTHRHYAELEVGIPKDYSGKYGPVSHVVRRLQGRVPGDRYFRKVDAWEPSWDFYAPF